MKLAIEHETRYRFEEPAEHSIQYLRLTPRREPCQTTTAWDVRTPGDLRGWTDGFDNLAHVSVQAWPHQEVTVQVSGRVETVDTAGILPADDGLSPLLFRRDTRYTRVEGAIPELAAPFFEQRRDQGTLAALHGLMGAISEEVVYEPGYTSAESPASEALAAGRGVCQDHAHLLIAGARLLGVPARYVSGYLLAGSGNDSHLASHAWTEAFVEDLGWVSFDPANRQSATDAYVRLAIGFDYADAGPMRGLRQGGGEEKLNVRVQVEQRQELATVKGECRPAPPARGPVPRGTGRRARWRR